MFFKKRVDVGRNSPNKKSPIEGAWGKAKKPGLIALAFQFLRAAYVLSAELLLKPVGRCGRMRARSIA